MSSYKKAKYTEIQCHVFCVAVWHYNHANIPKVHVANIIHSYLVRSYDKHVHSY